MGAPPRRCRRPLARLRGSLAGLGHRRHSVAERETATGHGPVASPPDHGLLSPSARASVWRSPPGSIIGAVVPPIMPTWGVLAGAAPLGMLACGAALNGADEALWPALPVGLLGAGLAAMVSRDVAAGAARRQRGCGRRRRTGANRGDRDRGRLRCRGRRAQPRACHPFSLVALRRSPGSRCRVAAGRSASTRACGCSASTAGMAKKLVLVVVDAMHPADAARGRSRRAGHRPSPPSLERGKLVDDCVSSFPSVTPVASSEMMTGARARRPLGDGDELVPPGRAPLHRVRLLLRGDPDLRPVPGDVRPRLQHEPRPPQLGGADGVRAPRRRRDADRHHPVPDLPWPPPPRAQPRGPRAERRPRANFRHAVWAPGRVLLRRPLRQPPDRVRPDLHQARDPRRVLGLRRRRAGQRGRLRLPPLQPARQRLPLPPPRARRPGRVDREGRSELRPHRRRRRRPRRLPRASTPSSSPPTTRRPPVEHGLALADELGEDWRVLQPNADRPEDAEIAVSPTSRAAPSTSSTRRTPCRHPRAGPRCGCESWTRCRPDRLARRARRSPAHPGPASGSPPTGTVQRGGRAKRLRAPLPPRRPAARRPRCRLDGGAASPRRWRPTSPAAASRPRSIRTGSRDSGRRLPRPMPATS